MKKCIYNLLSEIEYEVKELRGLHVAKKRKITFCEI